MSKMLSAFTERTPKKLLINEAVILENFDFTIPYQDNLIEDNIMSATRGGVTINLIPTVRQTAIDGARVHTSDLLSIDDWEANATTSILELSAKNIQKALAFCDTITTNGVTEINPRYKVNPTDFKNYFILGEIGNNNMGIDEGQLMVVSLYNAINTVGMSIATAEKGEAVVPLTLTAHNKASTQNTPAFKISLIPTGEEVVAQTAQTIEYEG